MKDVKRLLNEVKGENAHKQAIAMGLKYKGFGYWVDPNSGEVTHKTENDQLVEVEPEVESEKAGAGGAEMAGGAPSGTFGDTSGMGGSFNTFMGKQPIGMGTNVQDIAPDGVAQSPNSDDGRWEPGPDGDNFVGDQTMADWNKPEKDAYVGRTNFYGWTAGPDGDNMTTMTYDEIIKRNISPNPEHHKSPTEVHEEIWNEILTETNKADADFTGRDTMVGKMLGKIPMKTKDNTMKAAKAAFDAVGPLTKRNILQSVEKTPAFTHHLGNEQEAGDYTKAIKAYRKMFDLPYSAEDKQQVNIMNQQAKGFLQNPNFDMSRKGEELGSGSFGSVYESEDGSAVIKEGEIGPGELMALNAMRNNPAFPNLLNAKFKTPFRHQSKMARLNYDDKGWNDIKTQTTQFDPDDYEDFDKRFPTATGTFAMSKAKGMPLGDAIYEMSEEQQEQLVEKLWRARAAMHMKGIAHNDMHAFNMFVDPSVDDGDVTMLDLGLAQNDHVAALMEAFGGITGEDYQLSNEMRMPDEMFSGMQERRQEIIDELRDMMSDGEIDENEWENFTAGGIRNKMGYLKELKEMFPALQDKKNILRLIKHFYGDYGMSDQESRMSGAFDKLQGDAEKLALANFFRRRRGAKDVDGLQDGPGINVRRPVPLKNLVLDPDAAERIKQNLDQDD